MNRNTDLWLVDMASGTPTRLTFDEGREGFPVWSPDGRQIAYMSQRPGGPMNLRVTRATGGGASDPLLETAAHKMVTGWSPDGRYLIYRVLDVTTGRDLWVMPVTGDRTPFPYLTSAAEEREAQFSPDGRWVTYQSNASGRFEVFVQSFPKPGTIWQISAAGGTQPRWRADGREVFYLAPDGMLMAVPLTTDPDGTSIEAGRPMPLFRPGIARGAVPGTLKHQYAVSRDVRFLVNVEAGTVGASPITVVLHWDARR